MFPLEFSNFSGPLIYLKFCIVYGYYSVFPLYGYKQCCQVVAGSDGENTS